MGTSRAIAAPGLRTVVATGWRADVSSIAQTLAAHPRLLISGMLGFALRGGILILTVPILVLPTSVEVRLLLGGNIDSTGLTPDFYILVAALSIATLAAAVVVLYLIARCELATFTRFVNSSQPSVEHVWLPPGRISADSRGTVIQRLFVVQAVALLAVLVAALPLAAALGQATMSEILLPSSSDSIYVRIVNDVIAPLVAWLAAIVVIEAVSAIATRRVLAPAFGLRGHFRIYRHPVRVLAVAALSWLLFIGVVVAIYAGLSITWQAVESVFLSTGLSGGLREIVSGMLIAVVFGVVFALAFVVGGVVSAIRAGLWTLASLR